LPVINKIELMDIYSGYLRNKIKQGVNSKNYDLPLKGLKVLVDAGNGAGGFFVDKVLNPLGAITKGSQYLDPDGYFPNHIPNPEDKKAMESIQEAVIKNKADLGLIFDTDVDRASAVDRYGRAINKNAIVALMGAIVAKDYPVSVIVTDSVTSDKLTDFLENDLKMIHRRFKRGYKNIINEAIRLNNEGISCYLAIETSGHCALGENFFLDDGAYMTVKILIEAAKLKKEGKTIDMLISKLQEAKEAQEFRLKLKCDKFKEYGQMILRDFEEYCSNKEGLSVAKNSYEGVRVSFDSRLIKGWLLLRMSLHDPLMPLNIETDNFGGLSEIKKIMFEFFKNYEYIDISSLK
jgi:phosphomannomutase